MRKYQPIEKQCPYCKGKFQTLLGHRKEKTMCSRKCANKMFAKPFSDSRKLKISDGVKNTNVKNNRVAEITVKKVCNVCSAEFFSKKKHQKFCGRTCAAVYNNGHKTKGSCRSKLEVWLEEKLNGQYPTLEILYNKREAIDAELDIYIPSLKIAFELNGIFHYKPIFGEEKLNITRNNDRKKLQACIDKQIELCIIDASSEKYFNESDSIKYLKLISEIIDTKKQFSTVT